MGTITHCDYSDKTTGGGGARFGGFGGSSSDSSQISIMAGNANNPLMNECMDNAIAQLAAKLTQTFPKLPPRTPAIEGLVADANGSGQLVLNVGAHDGVKLGDRLQVWPARKFGIRRATSC